MLIVGLLFPFRKLMCLTIKAHRYYHLFFDSLWTWFQKRGVYIINFGWALNTEKKGTGDMETKDNKKGGDLILFRSFVIFKFFFKERGRGS